MTHERMVTLYRRANCGPCEVALALLEAFAAEFRFGIATVDIDSDPELVRRYGERIPVATIGEREIASAPFRRGVVEDALAEAFGA